MLILDQLSVLGAAADVGPGQDRCKVEGGKKEEGNSLPPQRVLVLFICAPSGFHA